VIAVPLLLQEQAIRSRLCSMEQPYQVSRRDTFSLKQLRAIQAAMQNIKRAPVRRVKDKNAAALSA